MPLSAESLRYISVTLKIPKTFEALAIIKYFELRNNRVLVLCPKKLRENWTVYQAHNNDKSKTKPSFAVNKVSDMA